MSYSYKLVLILSLIQGNGGITLDEAASFFLKFYSTRLELGLIAENATQSIATLSVLSSR